MSRFDDPNRGDVILNPFDPRSQNWNMLNEIRNEYSFEQLARSLIPEGNGGAVPSRLAMTIPLGEHRKTGVAMLSSPQSVQN